MSYRLPADISVLSDEDLRDLRLEMVKTKKLIELQLTNKDARDESGNRIKAKDWHTWRFQAVGAIRHADRDIQIIKNEQTAREKARRKPKANTRRPEVFGPLYRLSDAIAAWPEAPDAVVDAADALCDALEHYIAKDEEQTNGE
jgi:hypothetical protein